MSLSERNDYTKQMNWSKVAMIALFAIVFFFAFAVPALKNTYGEHLLVLGEQSY